ncbi:hypothetical protein CVU37_11430 [candidate division BRC1 bacterium HGW-BRC1-1]|jgi:hypothetical protein|nr:MAG: hypothetical protein CVU37_11430 [candidate division BRC1 bacterium HGW-BRC1-1]
MIKTSVRNLLPAAAFAFVMLLAPGCSTCRIPTDPSGVCAGDRCHIEDEWFILADQAYARWGTLALTHRYLREELQWRECEANEAIYRLRKVHTLP